MSSPETDPTSDLRRTLGGGVLSLDIEDILRILPHRPPTLLVDRVLALTPGQHATGTKAVSGNEYGLATRKHGFVFPATLAAEALAQLGMLVLLCPADGKVPAGTPDPGLFADQVTIHVASMEVHRELASAELLHLDVAVVERVEDGARLRGQATFLGHTYVSAALEITGLPSCA